MVAISKTEKMLLIKKVLVRVISNDIANVRETASNKQLNYTLKKNGVAKNTKANPGW